MRFKSTLKVMLVVAVVSSALFYAIRNLHKSVEVIEVKLSDYDEGENDRQEEVKARMEQEVLMTRDPQLGYVPIEKLLEAEIKSKELMAITQMNSPQALLSWAERGPNNLGGRSRSIIIDQADATGNTVLVGSVSGGVWRTTNFLAGSPTWSQIATVSANLAITCMAQDPSNLSVMYAGTGEGYNNFDAVRGLGIYKSTNGGLTWALLASTTTAGANVNDFNFVQDIVVYSNGHVYASGISAVNCNRGGVLKSTNAGTSWTRVIGQFNLPQTSCNDAQDYFGYDLEISAGGDIYASVVDFDQVYPPINGNPEGKIYKSPAGVNVGNAGTWVNITPAAEPGNYWQRIELACAPSNNNVVYAMFQDAGNNIDTILRSDNAGTSWNNIDNTTVWCDNGSMTSIDFSRGQAWYDLILAVKPDDAATVFAGGVDIMKSTNSGGTWVQNTQWASGCPPLPFVHADIHNIVYLPGSTTQFIVVNDGGIYYTADNGNTYTNKSTGYNTIQYYANAIHPTAGSNYMLGGSQDNGSHKFSAAGLGSVTTATGGDGAFCFIDQDNPTIQVTSLTKSNYIVSRDGGTNFNVSAGFSGANRFINPADYDNTLNIIYAGFSTGALLRISNIPGPGAVVGTGFTIIAGATGNDFAISAVKVDPLRPDAVWIAFSNKDNPTANVAPRLYRIDNASTGAPGATQFALPAGFVLGSYISSIDIDPSNMNHLIMTVSNYGVTSVWESTDGATTWNSIEGNLPNFPVRWAMFVPAGFNPGSGTNAIGGVMLATELGVWSTSALSGVTTTWIPNNTSMGNVRTDMLKLRNSDKVVAVATHGRGIFTATLFTTVPVDFVSFTGKAEQKLNKLKWKVENEFDNTGYEIERKHKGERDFVKIGFVPAKNSVTHANEYSFDDALVDLGKEDASYRLKQIDIDKKFTYSNIISLQRKASGKFVEYTSVTGNQLLIRINGGNNDQLTLRLFDIAGRLLKKSIIMNKSQFVDISGLPRSAFVVDIMHPDGRRFTKKMIY